MQRSNRLTLLCLGLFLVLFPLVVGKPGLPTNLKADEPAYYLMALSLARDGDLKCELQDIRRLFDEYPYREVRNLILMSGDGWRTVYFGKPYIYSLFAAPAAALFGANGLVSFNMLLLVAMIWMGTSYLGRYNTSGTAALFAVGFFLLSNGFAYVFWLQPEIFNMAAIMAALYLAFHEFDSSLGSSRLARVWVKLFNPVTQAALSGALLSFAIYNKPMLGALGLPAAYLFFRRRGFRGLVVFVLGAAIMLGLVAGLATALTDHPTAYLGVSRGGTTVRGPDQMPTYGMEQRLRRASSTQNSWSWIFRLPSLSWRSLGENVPYFLWGRHTGLFVYSPFVLLALLLFLVHERRSAARWLTLAGLGAVALFFLIWIPTNWHGGGGFVGNRYFINACPAFLFLVTRIRPVWSTALGYAAGGLLLGPILFTPFGAPVVESTLQAHVRSAPFRFFPLEFSLRRRIPGYRGVASSGVYFEGRKDVFRPRGDEMWLHGATIVELWLHSRELLDELVFEVRNVAPGNRLRLAVGQARETLEFPLELPAGGETRRITLAPSEPSKIRWEKGRKILIYKMEVSSSTGRHPERTGGRDGFYLGAALTYLGTREQLDRDLYRLVWGAIEVPERVEAGELFEITTLLENRSSSTWEATGPVRVNLSYHWLNDSGEVVIRDGRRTPLPGDLPVGRRLEVAQKILAPEAAGLYTLVLDPVREKVAWFSQRNRGNTFRADVEVFAAEPANAP